MVESFENLNLAPTDKICGPQVLGGLISSFASTISTGASSLVCTWFMEKLLVNAAFVKGGEPQGFLRKNQMQVLTLPVYQAN